MAEKIGFSDPEDDSLCFSLNECTDGATIERALPPEREILGIMETWFGRPGARFIFMLKLYTHSLVASKDPKVVHMMFIQGVYNVITATYPTTEKDAVHLAALQFQAKFGQHNAASHKPGFLKNMLPEFMPAPHLDAASKKPVEAWEQQIFYKHAFSTTAAPREAYLDLLKKRDYYGAVFFAVKQRFTRNMPKRVFMAISRRGILLLKIPPNFTDHDLDLLGSYNLSDIYRWAYKPGVNFYFEMKDESSVTNPVYTFDTAEGKHMSDMLTDYAMALLREMGLNPDGTRRIKPSERAAAAAAAAAAAEAGEAAGASEQAWGEAGGEADVLPTKSAMATSEEAYSEVGGEVGHLASAAVRSGEWTDGAAAGEGVSGGAPPPPPPPPPPDAGAAAAPEAPEDAAALPAPAKLLSSPAAPVADEAAPAEAPLPPNWSRVLDEASGQHYFFNTSTGESSWEVPK